MAIRFLTAGESHGPALTVVVEGLPAGIPVERERLDLDLARRMKGYGRGARMEIEKDRVEVLGGVRFGKTLGSPVSIVIRNRDFENWSEAMATDGLPPTDPARARRVTRPRPGHADLSGALKYGTHDVRDVLERASARETAARTAAGAIARSLLGAAGVDVTSRTVSVGDVTAEEPDDDGFEALLALPLDAPFRCSDPATVQAMIEAVDEARRRGDSIGGVFEVLARGVPAGLGSMAHWDRRLDGRLGGAILSIQGVKAASIGEGVESSRRRGSEVHDAIGYDPVEGRFTRASNRAGGIEGGMSNGEMIRLRGHLKPLATLARPLASVDLVDKTAADASVERTDTIPIVAAGVVAEAMTCLVLADELLIKFGGDSLDELLRSLELYRDALRRF